MPTQSEDTTKARRVTSEAFVRAALARAPVALLRSERKRELGRIQRELKATAAPASPESLLDLNSYLERFDRTRFLAPDSEVFLRAGLSPDLPTLGIFGKAVVRSDTLWEALSVTKDFITYWHPSSHVHLNLKNGQCRIIYDPRLDEQPGRTEDTQYIVALFVYVIRMAKWYSGTILRLYYPRARSLHSPLFPDATSVRSAAVGRIYFDDALLRSPMLHADSRKCSITKATMLKYRDRSIGPTDIAELVWALQFASVHSWHGRITLNDVALLLDMPARTLQERLKNANSSFACIRNNVLHQVAQRELLAGRSINEIAGMLGFEHRQSFSEAFSAWENQSPSEFASRGKAEIAGCFNETERT